MRFGRPRPSQYSGTSGFIDGPKKGHYRVKVRLLDDTELSHDFPKKAKGQAVLDHVFWTLDLEEKDYFGLSFQTDQEEKQWLDATKTLRKQLNRPYYLEFCVKFYVPDPAKLREELTRYLFFLQVKRDLLIGKLEAPARVAAELFALAVQSELGDYDPAVHDGCYVSEFRFLPSQSVELEEEIGEFHKTSLVGQTPAAAELSFLHKAKWLDSYGVELHPVMGMDKVSLQLGLTPCGIIVHQNKTKVGSFMWSRINNICFKRKKFSVRVQGREPGQPEATFDFLLMNSRNCKQLWRSAIEQHTFFRLMEASEVKPKRLTFFRRSSKYRFSGRTQWQAEKEANRQRPEPKFQRTPSRRYARRSFHGPPAQRWNSPDDPMFMRANSVRLPRTVDGDRPSGLLTTTNQARGRVQGAVSRTQERRGVNEIDSRSGRLHDVSVRGTTAASHPSASTKDKRSLVPPHSEIAVQPLSDTIGAFQSRTLPQAELQQDIQRLGQRPVAQSSSYHFDHPSSRRQYGSSMSVRSGSSDQQTIPAQRTMSNQSVLLRLHPPVAQYPELPTHVSTENIPTDDEPPPAYTPYPSTVVPPISSASLRQVPSLFETCPPPPSIPAPPRPVRGVSPCPVIGVSPAPQSIGRARTRSNEMQKTPEVYGGMQDVASDDGSVARHMTEHQSESSYPMQSSGTERKPRFLSAAIANEQPERQQKQDDAVPPGQREADHRSVQLSDARVRQKDHQPERQPGVSQTTARQGTQSKLQKQPDIIRTTRTEEVRKQKEHQQVRQQGVSQTTARQDEQSRLQKQPDIIRATPTEEVQGRIRKQSQTKLPTFEQKEDTSRWPKASVQAEQVLQQSAKTLSSGERRDSEQGSVGAAVVREKQHIRLPSPHHAHSEERGTDRRFTSEERSVRTHKPSVLHGATEKIKRPHHVQDDGDLPILPVVMLDDLPPPPSPIMLDDLPPPPSPIRMSRSTERLLFSDDSDSEPSSPVILTPLTSPVPVRRSADLARRSFLTLPLRDEREGSIVSQSGSEFSLPPFPDNYGQDLCEILPDLELPPPPDHLQSRSRSRSPQSDQNKVELEDGQQPLLLPNRTWKSGDKKNSFMASVVSLSPTRHSGQSPPPAVERVDDGVEKATTPVEVSRLVARVRNSLGRSSQDEDRVALLSETDDVVQTDDAMQSPYHHSDSQVPPSVHSIMSPASDRERDQVGVGRYRSGYGSDRQDDFYDQYQGNRNRTRSSMPGQRYGSVIQTSLDQDHALHHGYVSDDNLRNKSARQDDSPMSTSSREFRYGKKERERLMEEADLFASRLRSWTASPQVGHPHRPNYVPSRGVVRHQRRHIMSPTSLSHHKPPSISVARSSSCEIIEFGSPLRGPVSPRPLAQALSTRPDIQHSVV